MASRSGIGRTRSMSTPTRRHAVTAYKPTPSECEALNCRPARPKRGASSGLPRGPYLKSSTCGSTRGTPRGSSAGLHGSPGSQSHVSGQHIEGCTQRSHHIHCLLGLPVKLVQQSNREVTLDDLTEVSRRGQVVIHATVYDQEFFPT